MTSNYFEVLSRQQRAAHGVNGYAPTLSSATSEPRVCILANGRATRYDGQFKGMLQLANGGRILSRILHEIIVALPSAEITVYVRPGQPDAQRFLNGIRSDIRIVEREPLGYFPDLLDIAREHSYPPMIVVDADLVLPAGVLVEFIRNTANGQTFLTIGVTSMQEQPSGRPAWVELDRVGRIRSLQRTVRADYRTIGMFNWGQGALRTSCEAAGTQSVMKYISDRITAVGDVFSFEVRGAVNVNSPDDLRAADILVVNELVDPCNTDKETHP